MSKSDQKIWRSSLWTTFLCIFGLCVSIYAYYVETKKEEDVSYEAFCDINESISCTKALNSQYGRGFGILNKVIPQNSPLNQPNSIFGFVFYTLQLILEFQNSVNGAKLQAAFSLISNLGTIYLSYVLIFKLKTFCAICVATYVINAFLLYFTYNKYRLLKSVGQSKRKHKKH
ncbi:Vitamin K epoxide reductase complex subunit 1-like protein 1 [Chamberlinius hualienensis]